MPWCHTCRVEYPVSLDACPECDGILTDVPAPERRLGVHGSAGLVVVAALPAEQAFIASGRLDAGGIPSALREAGGDGASTDPELVNVLVPTARRAEARRILLRPGRHRRNVNIFGWIFLATAIAVFLSAALFVARWMLNGSPLPR
jgi:hypothetical protein